MKSSTKIVKTRNWCTDNENVFVYRDIEVYISICMISSHLSEVIEPDEPGYRQEGELIAYTLEHTVRMLTATPRQRTEAAYMTLKEFNN